MMQARTPEVAWAAGLWDGEGHASHRVDTYGHHGCVAKLGMTGRAIVERFVRAAAIPRRGTASIRAASAPPPGHKQQWVWTATRLGDVRQLAFALWPYLSEAKRAQFRGILASCRSSAHERPRERGRFVPQT
jgi:hypothetical protein